MSDIWDNNKAKQQRAAAERLRGNTGGKGDRARNNNSEAFRLGMKLLELKKGTKEYEATLNAWRTAQQKGR